MLLTHYWSRLVDGMDRRHALVVFLIPVLPASSCGSWGNFWGAPTLRYSSSQYAFAQYRAISTVRPEVSADLISCEVTPSLLSGLMLNEATCAVSGTPDGPLQGSLPYSVSAKGHGGIVTAVISIRISGMTAADDGIYIADMNNNRVLVY